MRAIVRGAAALSMVLALAEPLFAQPAADLAPAGSESAQALGQPRDDSNDRGEQVSDARSPRFLVQGFGDIELFSDTSSVKTSSFTLGQLVFFANSRLSDELSVLAEVVVEVGPKGEFVTDVERLHLTYSPSDLLRVRLGRYHTGIGYYNTAFHHAAYFETSAGRPILFAFEDEGGVLPVHDIGLSVSGRIPSGPWGLEYLAEVANGQNWEPDLAHATPTSFDTDGTKSTNLGLSLAPDRFAGLRIGVSSYRDRTSGADIGPVAARFDAVYFAYRRANTMISAESVWLHHRAEMDPSGSRYTNQGFYAEGSHSFGKVRPFIRFERLRIDRATPLIGSIPSVEGPTIGLRVDPMALVALKAQFEHIAHRGQSDTNRFKVQVAFAF